MSESGPLRGQVRASADAVVRSPPESFAGRMRYAQLEYEAILANASIGIAFTRDRRFFLCNRRFAEMFGYAAEELIGQSGEVIYPDADSHAALAQVAAPLLRAGRQVDLEWEMRRRDGSTFPVRMIARAIDVARPPQGTVWMIEDLAETRRHADEAARLLREQEAILGNVSIGIVFVKDRRIVRCNRRYEQMYGYDPGELHGKPTAVLYPDLSHHARAAQVYDQLSRGETSRRVEQRRRKDGSLFWSRADGRAVDPRDPHKGSVWIVEDITERRGADQALERLMREQNAVLENPIIGIAFINAGRVTRANRRFEELFGGELAIGADFDTRTETPLLTRTHRRPDGTKLWYAMSGRPVQADDPSQGAVWLFEDITRKRETEERIEQAAAEQELILDNASVGIAFVRNRVVQRCNRFLEEMVGAGPGELAGQSSAVLFASMADWEAAGRQAFLGTEPGKAHESEWLFRRRDGSTFRCRTRGRRIDLGEPEQQWIWSFEDVTAQREAEARVRRALAEQELILDNATVGIAFLRNRTYQRCNRRFEEMFGYAAEEVVGRGTELIYASREAWQADESWYAAMGRGEAVSAERQYRRKDGTLFWCKLVGRAIDPAHPLEGSIWIYDDVTSEHEAREALQASRDALERAVAERTAELQTANARARHLADHDALTGLPNRRLLEDRLTQALALSYRNRKQTAVMFVDLDRFKAINDSLGHAAGDALLKEVAQRLVRQLRTGDTICRMGGDEFVVVLPEINRAGDAAQVAQKVLEQLSAPVTIEECELQVTPSVGIAVFPEDGRDAETLIRNADAAMYHAKEMGRANYRFFTADMNQVASRRLALEQDLRRALGRDELRVHYQPFVERGGRVVGHEALVRWQHADRGLLLPAEFVPLAEETGTILGLGGWVLTQACRWATFVGVERSLQVTVNLSPRQFSDPRLVQLVAAALRDTGLPPRLLELDIAESTAMQHTDVTLATFARLKDLGVSIAIDDFGTGCSSLPYLKRFSPGKVKIDRSLSAALPGDADQRAIVSAIVALAHALDIRVMAQGVENEAQRRFLEDCGCDYLQGYLFGAPADADAAAQPYL